MICLFRDFGSYVCTDESIMIEGRCVGKHPMHPAFHGTDREFN